MIKLDYSKFNGLLPAVAQDHESGRVLMVAFMNEQAFNLTVETKIAHYWSRSRQELWKKGGTSGHVQKVHEIWVDCDNDTVVLKIEQIGGAACHKGYESCFYQKLDDNGEPHIYEEPVFDPKEVYGK